MKGDCLPKGSIGQECIDWLEKVNWVSEPSPLTAEISSNIFDNKGDNYICDLYEASLPVSSMVHSLLCLAVTGVNG